MYTRMLDWSREDDKRFEEALVRFPEDSPDRWKNIAEYLKMPLEEVKMYYEALVHDIALIESGQIDVDYSVVTAESTMESKKKEIDRKRGIPWTKDEHGWFLEGLEKYGRGDWKSIARDFVKTRTATQVASHAQKFYQRQNSETKARKRTSIHDITKVDTDNAVVPRSNLQPHFDDQVPPEYSHDYFGH